MSDSAPFPMEARIRLKRKVDANVCPGCDKRVRSTSHLPSLLIDGLERAFHCACWDRWHGHRPKGRLK